MDRGGHPSVGASRLALAPTWAIIQAIGGCSPTARALDCRPQTVSNWQTTKGIPPKRWDALVAIGRERGANHVTIEALRAAHRAAARARVGRTRARKA